MRLVPITPDQAAFIWDRNGDVLTPNPFGDGYHPLRYTPTDRINLATGLVSRRTLNQFTRRADFPVRAGSGGDTTNHHRG